MSRNAKLFFLAVAVNFVVLAVISVLFEYFDRGDDPLYSPKVAIKNLVMSLVIAGTVTLMNRNANHEPAEQ